MSSVMDILKAIVQEKQTQYDMLLTSDKIINGVIAVSPKDLSEAKEAVLRAMLEVELRDEQEKKVLPPTITKENDIKTSLATLMTKFNRMPKGDAKIPESFDCQSEMDKFQASELDIKCKEGCQLGRHSGPCQDSKGNKL